MNFKDITYLSQGSAEQQRIYKLLVQTDILESLKQYDPIVVGTFPLDIQVATSDIDILSQANDLEQLAQQMTDAFGKEDEFKINRVAALAGPAIVASFKIAGQEFELFGQDVPSDLQMGYLHMVKEYEILQKFGEKFKQQVIALKASGIKTEPAFCQLLDIDGDPYLNLLKYEV
ncbi:DUF4269 domain-containing protein [Mucilaginibacter myungsuensis]|uniref:DUF4269 domain-containing protein n=1 Tax=Mucilaginibacter myungsuensis TaxID=649104 RepID=A0A929KZG4_9SPHI|nr:DUF4269 domain-containing protein [Mucilaginibacter myungsuensis]MBE9664554.1 DUF4269 domain-containing protein [Mucilaginibacter myungsuensis]MDN3601096.1 DUF4269 domain-containing protein [Mucilaginibacter myungsuensis]